MIDFSEFSDGDRINLMNIADQTSGKGRTGVFAADDLEVRAEGRAVPGDAVRNVDDPSRDSGV